MSSRALIAIFIAAWPAAAAIAASDETCTRETLRPVAAPAHAQIYALFEKTNEGPPLDGVEVLIARIAPDGKPVLACVDSAAAAKKFLEAPIETTSQGSRREK